MTDLKERLRGLADASEIDGYRDQELYAAADKIEALEAALTEVMEWVQSWTPDFVYDEEWAGTQIKVSRALDTPRG